MDDLDSENLWHRNEGAPAKTQGALARSNRDPRLPSQAQFTPVWKTQLPGTGASLDADLGGGDLDSLGDQPLLEGLFDGSSAAALQGAVATEAEGLQPHHQQQQQQQQQIQEPGLDQSAAPGMRQDSALSGAPAAAAPAAPSGVLDRLSKLFMAPLRGPIKPPMLFPPGGAGAAAARAAAAAAGAPAQQQRPAPPLPPPGAAPAAPAPASQAPGPIGAGDVRAGLLVTPEQLVAARNGMQLDGTPLCAEQEAVPTASPHSIHFGGSSMAGGTSVQELSFQLDARSASLQQQQLEGSLITLAEQPASLSDPQQQQQPHQEPASPQHQQQSDSAQHQQEAVSLQQQFDSPSAQQQQQFDSQGSPALHHSPAGSPNATAFASLPGSLRGTKSLGGGGGTKSMGGATEYTDLHSPQAQASSDHDSILQHPVQQPGGGRARRIEGMSTPFTQLLRLPQLQPTHRMGSPVSGAQQASASEGAASAAHAAGGALERLQLPLAGTPLPFGHVMAGASEGGGSQAEDGSYAGNGTCSTPPGGWQAQQQAPQQQAPQQRAPASNALMEAMRQLAAGRLPPSVAQARVATTAASAGVEGSEQQQLLVPGVSSPMQSGGGSTGVLRRGSGAGLASPVPRWSGGGGLTEGSACHARPRHDSGSSSAAGPVPSAALLLRSEPASQQQQEGDVDMHAADAAAAPAGHGMDAAGAPAGGTQLDAAAPGDPSMAAAQPQEEAHRQQHCAMSPAAARLPPRFPQAASLPGSPMARDALHPLVSPLAGSLLPEWGGSEEPPEHGHAQQGGHHSQLPGTGAALAPDAAAAAMMPAQQVQLAEQQKDDSVPDADANAVAQAPLPEAGGRADGTASAPAVEPLQEGSAQPGCSSAAQRTRSSEVASAGAGGGAAGSQSRGSLFLGGAPTGGEASGDEASSGSGEQEEEGEEEDEEEGSSSSGDSPAWQQQQLTMFGMAPSAGIADHSPAPFSLIACPPGGSTSPGALGCTEVQQGSPHGVRDAMSPIPFAGACSPEALPVCADAGGLAPTQLVTPESPTQQAGSGGTAGAQPVQQQQRLITEVLLPGTQLVVTSSQVLPGTQLVVTSSQVVPATQLEDAGSEQHSKPEAPAAATPDAAGAADAGDAGEAAGTAAGDHSDGDVEMADAGGSPAACDPATAAMAAAQVQQHTEGQLEGKQLQHGEGEAEEEDEDEEQGGALGEDGRLTKRAKTCLWADLASWDAPAVESQREQMLAAEEGTWGSEDDCEELPGMQYVYEVLEVRAASELRGLHSLEGWLDRLGCTPAEKAAALRAAPH